MLPTLSGEVQPLLQVAKPVGSSQKAALSHALEFEVSPAKKVTVSQLGLLPFKNHPLLL